MTGGHQAVSIRVRFDTHLRVEMLVPRSLGHTFIPRTMKVLVVYYTGLRMVVKSTRTLVARINAYSNCHRLA